MKFSRWVCCLAGIYGLIVLLPQFILEQKLGGFGRTVSHRLVANQKALGWETLAVFTRSASLYY
jgi:hypothetical protein